MIKFTVVVDTPATSKPALPVEKKVKVLVLYTGGTIGMVKNGDGVYAPKANVFVNRVKSMPEMHSEVIAAQVAECQCGDKFLVMPELHKNQRIIYNIKEYDPLLDSSNMSAEDWVKIARDIEKNYSEYDAFVVLHGTDTLAFTASALSFILEGLEKTVVVTGAMIPIFEAGTDARGNFYSSLIFSACYNVPEVCVCFNHILLRGNRTVKYGNNTLKAFISPNNPLLGEVKVQFRVFSQSVLKQNPARPLKLYTDLQKVGVLVITPLISDEMVEAFLKQPIQGVVLETYGAGNIPSNRWAFVELLKYAVQSGVIIVNITQCLEGIVETSYETGKALDDIGILSGYDMTRECAVTKLSYVLGLSNFSLEDKKKMMKMNLRGELTEDISD